MDADPNASPAKSTPEKPLKHSADPGAGSALAGERGAHPKHSEALRSAVHLSGLLLAFPLTYIAQPERLADGKSWAVGVCLCGVLFNMLVLPNLKIGQALKREGEGFVNGTWMYPLGLALAFLLYPPYAVAAAWAAMAAGDAAAVTFGSRIPKPRLPWNTKKSWVGSAAFVCAALVACQLLLWWSPAPMFLKADGTPEWPYVWTLAVVAALSGALLESLEGPFDDNLRVPLGVGLLVWLTAELLCFGTSGMPEARAFQPEWFLHALTLNAVLVALVWALKFADLPGAIAGGVLGTAVYFFTLPQGYALLLFFVVAGSLLSRVGRAKKEARGAAEARGGKRGLANVLANFGVPVLCALAYKLTLGHPAALLAYAGALSAVLADTTSSEIGALSSKPPVLITSRQPVGHGTNGAVTRLGYLAAALACALFAALAWTSGFWSVLLSGHEWNTPAVTPWQGLGLSLSVLFSGLLGTTVDSYLGAMVEGKIPGMGKGAVNFLCALTGAGLGGVIGVIFYAK